MASKAQDGIAAAEMSRLHFIFTMSGSVDVCRPSLFTSLWLLTKPQWWATIR